MLIIASLVLLGTGEAVSAKLADGTYEVDYLVKKPDDESVSIANDYFGKPARVDVQNGEATVYFQTNHNKWIKSLKYATGGEELEVVDANEAEDTKIIRLPHTNVFEPAFILVHVIIDELDYDQAYSVRLVFNTDQLPLASESVAPAEGTSSGDSTGSDDSGSKPSGASMPDAKDEPGITEPAQQEQAEAESKKQHQAASDTDVNHESANDSGGAGDASDAASDAILDTDAGASTVSDQGAASDAAVTDGEQLTAEQPLVGSAAEDDTGRSAWLIIVLIVSAGIALAAIFLSYRRNRSKR